MSDRLTHDQLLTHSVKLSHNISLTLEIDANGKKGTLLTGMIEKLNLSLEPYGHTCGVVFSSFSEEVDGVFNDPAFKKVSLKFNSIDPFTQQEKGAPLLELKGLVLLKASKPLPPIENKDRMANLYEVWFSDSAKATWGNYYPAENVYVDESMKEILEKHKKPGIEIKYEWDKLETKHPITAFSLPDNPGKKGAHPSFYSFLFWYLHQENGIFTYDYKKDSYSLSGKKVKAPGEPLKIFERWVDTPHTIPAPIPRYNQNKVSHTPVKADVVPKENKESYKGVHRDTLDHKHYHRHPHMSPEEVHSALHPEKDLHVVEFAEMEHLLIDKLLPGSAVTFIDDKGGSWSKAYKSKKLRVRGLYIRSDKVSETETTEKKVQNFHTGIRVVIEEEDEPFAPRPYFEMPVFPFHIQGTIFSDVGDKNQMTHKIQESDKAPLGQYLVESPKVQNGKHIVAPFTVDPNGHDHRPLTKGRHVEMAMHFRTALIDSCIGWGDNVRLSNDVLGNQFLLGSNGENEYCFIRHEYKDGKESFFVVKQSCSETQTQTIEIQKEDITITVDEKDKKKVHITLQKDKGVVISYEDKEASALQQILFDGKAITLLCKGSAGTSTIVQKPDSISLECDNLNIKAKKINLKGEENFVLDAPNSTITAKSGLGITTPSMKVAK